MDFQNQATLSYNNNIVKSNVVSGKITAPYSITKFSSQWTYKLGSEIAYTIVVENYLDAETPMIVYDDMGLFYIDQTPHMPLTHDMFSTIFIVVTPTGTFQRPAGVITEKDKIGFSIIMPAKSTAFISYVARVNSFADINPQATIKNNATLQVAPYSQVNSDNIISVRNYSDIRIAKYMPNKQVSVDQPLSYVFVVNNYGNTAVSPVLSDFIEPNLTDITVSGNGSIWTEGTQYEYDPTTSIMTIPKGSFTLTPATSVQNPATGEWILTPSSFEIAITGTVASPTIPSR